ncbi:MAG: sigma-54-dependent Fis family transcriptional regulator [Deltaproteobacteria bacterium]|nr:sigma-54-dependent Fis family transcriptional regulator [Deltaproteobacteria bacterium]
MAERILVVEDEIEMLEFLSRFLTRKGYQVDSAAGGEEAWKAIGETVYDLVITDLALQDINGIELLERVRVTDAILPFIIMTGVGTIESAVDAIKRGAFHYLTKPFKVQDMEILARRAIEYGALHRKLDKLHDKETEKEERAPVIIGSSKPMSDLLHRVNKIADSMASVMILGETGTGKSLLAKHVHFNSSRRDNPFLTIDCGALTETLLESELFGHVKGSFTGAIRAKRGLLEDSQGGTIFLDEICEISPQTQIKLLRAIQEREIKPVGGNKSVTIDVRFISATSRDIKSEVEKGQFREELYYRLAVVPIYLPPLRERKEDLPLLIDFYLKTFCQTYKKKINHVNLDFLETLYHWPWRGNIRELANVMERSILLSEDGILTLDCLCTEIPLGQKETEIPLTQLSQVLREAEKKAIINAMRLTGNNRSESARLLGISRRALYDKLALYNLT